jgi:predicted nucleotidyltransferase
MATLRRLHELLSRRGVAYCVVGGVAVVRNGATRTTHDIDILVDRPGWRSIHGTHDSFAIGPESALDEETGIPIDAIFPGDEWEMAIELPPPESIAEFDTDLGAWFATLPALVAIKTAVYLRKRADEGEELAAKDLADIVSLVQANAPDRILEAVAAAPEPVRGELLRIAKRVMGSGRRD